MPRTGAPIPLQSPSPFRGDSERIEEVRTMHEESEERSETRSIQPVPDIVDQALIQRIAGGDTDALGLLYDRYGRQVFNAALRIVGDYGMAEEITQDTFLRLWERAAQYC